MRKSITAFAVLAALSMAPVLAPQGAMAADKKAKAEKTAVEIPAPPEGKGQVVFWRGGGQGFLLGCAVNENGEKISSLGAGKYFAVVLEPGEHSFMVQSEAKDVLTLEVEPDETQYVQCKIKMGLLAGRPNISPSTKADFDKKSAKLKLVDEDDMGPLARRM